MDLVRIVLRRTLSLVVAVLVLGSAPAYAQFLSPGDLAGGHAHLDGDAHCSDCHTAGRQIENGKCTACHDDVGATLARGTGLHGRNYKGQSCANCHVDHRGRGSRLIRWNPRSFDHALSGWKLQDAHAGLDCNSCHNRVNRRGAKTYLGLSSSCASCHQDPHKGRFGNECLDCHNQGRFDVVALHDFNHDLARFKLLGAHQKVDCAKCHGVPAKYQLPFQRCGNCHEDPHAGRFGDVCTGCHNNDSWKSIDMKRSAHPGLSLFGGHSKASCKQCHDRGLLKKPSRGTRCVGCHAPIHEANFGNNCAQCHKGIKWLGLPRQVGLDAHDKTPFALTGKHVDVACTECHSPELIPQKRFRELKFERCIDCHDDKHQGEFSARNGGECGACHTDAGFRPSQFGVQLHATTAFPLIGNHQAVPCGTCHDNFKQKQRLNWKLENQKCEKCHDNPHGDQFRKEMQQGGCAHCHSPLAWDLPNIAHDTWPLIGAHASARCDQCHSPTPEDRKAGRGASYKDAPRECEGCHQDIHQGQFRLTEPKRDCGDCHTPWKFKLPEFNHTEMTGYELQGKHATLKCESCHQSTKLAQGTSAVRYRLPYNTCRDCHADPHAPAEEGSSSNAR